MENGKELIVDGWFTEHWDEQNWSLMVEEVLYHEKSKFQDILVFKSKTYGNVLVLDGGIQCTERDEFSYQEMIAHMPLNCHQNPKHVLIVGGGDGGVLREVLKHDEVETVTQVEIDEKVVEVCKKYFPTMACQYNHPKLRLHFQDGIEFVKNSKNMFDIIINDCTDRDLQDESSGSNPLFQLPYWKNLKQALRPGGIIIQQEESVFFHLDLIKKGFEMCRSLFPVVNYASAYIPSFCGGQGFRLCSSNPDVDFKEPIHKWSFEERKKRSLRYYNQNVHKAAFVLPEFADQALYPDDDFNKQ
ncbi:spermidine synthase-like [Amphiura filiformis]|uniref:spermidine synthase-like n=1 Tax=Amphiura filiformis TaxID=82378 RepID=UPI003B20DAA4